MNRIAFTLGVAAATLGGASRRTTLIALTAFAVLMSLVAASAASAAGPVREVITLDDTFTRDDCGFPVEEHAEGKLMLISWFDETGARTRQLVAAPGARLTWRNPVTGASVTTANTFVVHKTDNADGSATIAFTGLVFAIRGGGTTYIDSGRDLIVFSDGGVEPLASSGPSADLCAALTAAIG